MQTKTLSFIMALSLAANGFLGYQALKNKGLEKTSVQFPYLSKRIFAENQNDIIINFTPLRTALREYIGELKDPIGVYFEFLPSGVSVGVNDSLETKLVSLAKIPVAMAIYKEIEKGKIQKDEMLIIGKEDLDKEFGNLWQKGAGTKLTVQEAVRLALIESDNTAANALALHVGYKAVQDVFDSLDVTLNKTTENTLNTLTVTPKGYSSILRSLYLSSYLSKKSSDEILDILTQTIFNDKIPASIPPNIKVAHKIGVFELKDGSDKAYNDCGIVYVPQRPYMLCVMAHSDEAEAREYMQYISKMVYGYISVVKGVRN